MQRLNRFCLEISRKDIISSLFFLSHVKATEEGFSGNDFCKPELISCRSNLNCFVCIPVFDVASSAKTKTKTKKVHYRLSMFAFINSDILCLKTSLG